jgi:hypothetical protein
VELLLSVGSAKWVARSRSVVKELNRVMLICWSSHLTERNVSAAPSSHACHEIMPLKMRFRGSLCFSTGVPRRSECTYVSAHQRTGHKVW